MLTNQKLATLLWQHSEIKEILMIIDQLNLADGWLCAGTIRNFVWDYLNQGTIDSQLPILTTSDVDVIFYDPNISYEQTLLIEADLKQTFPSYQWELKNQFYMHIHNPNTPMYQSAQDAIAKFPETCTAIGARLHPKTKQLELFTPHTIADLSRFIVRPTPYFAENTERMMVYKNRIAKKAWHKRYPNIHYYP